ncbi:hypothetical protein DQ04_01201010 [Trypanosoma grayi]|uniref:hypothetical protein n=1 Tax=Trypanosoma grayi TaxID=71804 RepID=UPI0004F45872|nr:hypothetical protein DQ04_01201010 [Trypanosoma grayi]KEG13115.1 hypothetical protein DQ04_01201010 [Trypanosoma grayi]
MLSKSRMCLVRPFSVLSITLNECISNTNVEQWATLTMSRRSASDPWNVGIHQRRTSIYLNPLPEELISQSVVAKQFFSKEALPSSRAIRVLSVNGVPAVTAGKARREMNRRNTAILHVALQPTCYRRALTKAARPAAAEGGKKSFTVAEEVPADDSAAGRTAQDVASVKIPSGSDAEGEAHDLPNDSHEGSPRTKSTQKTSPKPTKKKPSKPRENTVARKQHDLPGPATARSVRKHGMAADGAAPVERTSAVGTPIAL